ncbi:MAG: hypothetical protein F4Z31_04110 [Gemmatimonadetes bacterium]|nr:hypothetical protein [Gemmatimonadota bacterium]
MTGGFIVSDGTGKPYRMRIRGPSFVNLQALPDMVKGGFVSDVVAAMGSIDIMLGEVDGYEREEKTYFFRLLAFLQSALT